MIYKEGFRVNGNLRFVKCPQCGNEEYSEEARFCRICGFPAYNECEGSTEYDEYGNPVGFSTHRNVGNARFCEYCGKKTMLFNQKFLKPYIDVQDVQVEQAQGEEDDSFSFDEEIPF